ncbi:putative bifunctional diguanylate cyclase/phosphodiesterase [Comamonas badia]|uniref:putative bifunctional diguanylate cyclase/phosphodiesterase n=1 Tax=Comamonas badia TaxID=265291 RepID=UPI0004234233|nr:GGDEF and EAL domain-containing protein [Comamonas badia]
MSHTARNKTQFGICLGALLLWAAFAWIPGLADFHPSGTRQLELHLALELSSVILCAMTVAIMWYDRNPAGRERGNWMVFGLALVALLDLLHALNYRSLLLPASSLANAEFVWYRQLARLAEVLVLLAFGLKLRGPGHKRYWLIAAVAVAAAIGNIGASHPAWLAQWLRDGAAPASPGMLLQYALVLADAACAALLYYRWRRDGGSHWLQLAALAFVLGVSNAAYIGHMGSLDGVGMAVHLLKIAVYFLGFRLALFFVVQRPQKMIAASQHTIMQQKRRLDALLNDIPLELVQLDTELNVRYANPRYTRRTGTTLDALQGTPWLSQWPQARRQSLERDLRAALQAKTTELDVQLDAEGAPAQRFHLVASPQLGGASGEGLVVMLTDTTAQESARMLMEASLKEVSELRAALDAHAIVAATDARGVIIKVNDKFCQISKYERSELLGKTHRVINSGLHPKGFFAAMWKVISSGEVWNGEICNRAKDGSLYWVQTTIVPFIGDEGIPVQYISIRADITQRKEAEEAAQQMALYDALTSLPNRRLLYEHIRTAMGKSADSRHHSALMLLDLDNFKEINDTLGHDQGDELLRQVARRLSHSVRPGDTVARLGGDEFVVLINGLSATLAGAAQETQTVAEKVRVALEQTYEFGGHTVHTSSSIGVSLFQGKATALEEVLKHADMALYRAKAHGRNQVCMFDPSMQAEVETHASLMADLRLALPRGELRLYYQAVVDKDRRPLGYEALLRWQHPERGMVPPLDFIAKAEDSGLIVPIGTWALQTACRQLARWAQSPETAHLTIAVNISARQFRDPEFVATVQRTLAVSGADPHRLRLELTESMFHSDVEQTIEKMNLLRALGTGFSLDDFGTGYSSLSYLKRMPLDVLKIDKSFVNDILTDPDDAAIAQTILALAETLELQVVAEGIEEPEQFEWLRLRDCHAYQGYLFSKPEPIEALAAAAHPLQDAVPAAGL